MGVLPEKVVLIGSKEFVFCTKIELSTDRISDFLSRQWNFTGRNLSSCSK